MGGAGFLARLGWKRAAGSMWQGSSQLRAARLLSPIQWCRLADTKGASSAACSMARKCAAPAAQGGSSTSPTERPFWRVPSARERELSRKSCLQRKRVGVGCVGWDEVRDGGLGVGGQAQLVCRAQRQGGRVCKQLDPAFHVGLVCPAI